MDNKIKKLKGANMDIDLTSPEDSTWKHDKCPWNESESTDEHKCAVKNISICKHFCGIGVSSKQDLDSVLCCYPNENPNY